MEGTILKTILDNCSEHPDRTAYNWLSSKCAVEELVTYRQLDERTREIAGELLSSVEACRGERVILCYPPGLEHILVLIACLRAGIIAGIAS